MWAARLTRPDIAYASAAAAQRYADEVCILQEYGAQEVGETIAVEGEIRYASAFIDITKFESDSSLNTGHMPGFAGKVEESELSTRQQKGGR